MILKSLVAKFIFFHITTCCDKHRLELPLWKGIRAKTPPSSNWGALSMFGLPHNAIRSHAASKGAVRTDAQSPLVVSKATLDSSLAMKHVDK